MRLRIQSDTSHPVLKVVDDEHLEGNVEVDDGDAVVDFNKIKIPGKRPKREAALTARTRSTYFDYSI